MYNTGRWCKGWDRAQQPSTFVGVWGFGGYYTIFSTFLAGFLVGFALNITFFCSRTLPISPPVICSIAYQHFASQIHQTSSRKSTNKHVLNVSNKTLEQDHVTGSGAEGYNKGHITHLTYITSLMSLVTAWVQTLAANAQESCRSPAELESHSNSRKIWKRSIKDVRYSGKNSITAICGLVAVCHLISDLYPASSFVWGRLLIPLTFDGYYSYDGRPRSRC